MEVEQIFHMNEGEGDTSYSNNSLIQKQVMLKAKQILEESITELYMKTSPECIKMADMGCSSGPNTLLLVSDIMDIIYTTCETLNRKKFPMFQVFLNDLPGNDFNTIFRSLPSFYERLKREKGSEFGSFCFIAAMPGSFYRRLFPDQFLHFVHSSCSLHWRSQVPELVSESGVALNKGTIYIAKTSPPSVLRAYVNLFQKDFTAFLRTRSEELIPGGHMVLINICREGNECTVWELLGITLHDMVLEGLIEEAKLDLFNLPFYAPTPEEMTLVIQAEGSFDIHQLKVVKVDWDFGYMDNGNNKSLTFDKNARGKYVAMSVRVAVESILASHFGDSIIEDLFERFGKKMGKYLEVEKGEHANMVVSMARK